MIKFTGEALTIGMVLNNYPYIGLVDSETKEIHGIAFKSVEAISAAQHFLEQVKSSMIERNELIAKGIVMKDGDDRAS